MASPQRILAALQGYRDSAALHTAIELELFTRIAHGVNTAPDIARQLSVPERGIRVLCDYLLSTGFLVKEGDQFRLPEDVAAFLDRSSRAYLADADAILYTPHLLRSYERLTDSVRGVAPPEADAKKHEHPAWFDLARGVIDPGASATAFAATFSFPPGKPFKILDVGAGSGAFGIALAQRYPEAIVVALDSPEALKAADANAARAKLGTRYQNIPGDPLQVPMGFEYDLAIMAGSLHQFTRNQITSLMMRIHWALKNTGQFAILEFLAEEGEFTRDWAGLRLNMLAATVRGDAYSVPEVKAMLESSGFRGVESLPVREAAAILVSARP